MLQARTDGDETVPREVVAEIVQELRLVDLDSHRARTVPAWAVVTPSRPGNASSRLSPIPTSHPNLANVVFLRLLLSYASPRLLRPGELRARSCAGPAGNDRRFDHSVHEIDHRDSAPESEDHVDRCQSRRGRRSEHLKLYVDSLSPRSQEKDAADARYEHTDRSREPEVGLRACYFFERFAAQKRPDTSREKVRALQGSNLFIRWTDERPQV